MADASKLLIEIQKAIPLEQYTLQEWNVAVAYITGVKSCYQTTEEARARIAAGR